ncbi:adenylyl-sulfate kinase [Oceanobacillus arenosus]|uniref:Adenylyl-sulfate kinase n=1 Tax=Oceanobacillus arenosus TaxID=1229153 RepID=A0A3D8PLN7_9BACI|nr:adenylyl-sulfate kinase [Oceanobacillus arenosus]RDW16407.1 adenylyl-sulfate kinase [Oceanobacillus arenosus]
MTEYKKKSENIIWHEGKVNKDDRRNLNKHTSAVLWFTGLSGSGKSTLAVEVERELSKRNIHTYILDGDNIRHGLNADLGFTPEDRLENIRRIGEVTKLFVDAGIITLAAFISPYQKERHQVRGLLDKHEFIEVYVKCSLEEVENRDPKGLYRMARCGKIKNFTGIDAPYESPKNPELIVETDQLSIQDSVKQVIGFLEQNGYITL